MQKKIAVVHITQAGMRIARTLQSVFSLNHLSRNEVAERWHDYDAFIFIGAMGICVRTIAPLVEDKHTDPAVICVDSMGQHVVSVLSGHVGGANDLTTRVARALGARPVITTQSDNAGLWALDTLEERFDWETRDTARMNACIFAFVNRKPTALLLEIRDEGTEYMEKTLPEHVTIISDISQADPQKYELLIMVTPYRREVPQGLLSLHFVPMVGTIGFGLAHHPENYEQINDLMDEALASLGAGAGGARRQPGAHHRGQRPDGRGACQRGAHALCTPLLHHRCQGR